MMKTKSRIFLPALVTLCLAACEKRGPVTENKGSGEGEYMLEVEGLRETRGAVPTVELNLANLAYDSSRTVSAQLKRRSGTSWVSVTDGVNYAWSASSADSRKFSGSGTGTKSCKISALSAGSGTMNVSASIGGTAVATKGVPVNVTDSRALSWTDVTTPIVSGSVNAATLNSNFSCTATVSSNNGSFVVGTSSTSMSPTVPVDFSGGTSKTIYYKYTGSQETTVRMDAVSSTITASRDIIVQGPGKSVVFQDNPWHAGPNCRQLSPSDYGDWQYRLSWQDIDESYYPGYADAELSDLSINLDINGIMGENQTCSLIPDKGRQPDKDAYCFYHSDNYIASHYANTRSRHHGVEITGKVFLNDDWEEQGGEGKNGEVSVYVESSAGEYYDRWDFQYNAYTFEEIGYPEHLDGWWTILNENIITADYFHAVYRNDAGEEYVRKFDGNTFTDNIEIVLENSMDAKSYVETFPNGYKVHFQLSPGETTTVYVKNRKCSNSERMLCLGVFMNHS